MSLRKLALAALVGALPIYAGSIAYTDPADQGRGPDCGYCNFALMFQVNHTIAVTALGLFNYSGTGYINGPVQVAIFEALPGGALLSPVVTFQGQYTPEGQGYDVFQTIPTLYLQPGLYLIDEFGLNVNGDLSGNVNWGSSGPILNDGGGWLTFVGAAYDMTGVFKNPLGNGPYGIDCYTCLDPIHQFDAATFEFDTPEPGSAGFLAGGLALFVITLYRRSRRSPRL